MNSDCLFCKIASKKIPSQIVYEDDEVFAFNDIQPQAPIHILFIPKEHFSKVNDIPSGNFIVSKLTDKACQIAKEKGFAADGFRLVINSGETGGQTVFHLHLHLLAGRFLQWPPG